METKFTVCIPENARVGADHKWLNQMIKDNIQARMEIQWQNIVEEDKVIQDGLEKESETSTSIYL